MCSEVIEGYGMHIEGSTRLPELEWLHNMASTMNSVVEIGSWYGRSTYALLSSGCPHVYAVDHFLGSPEHREHIDLGAKPYEGFMANVGNMPNLTVIKMGSAQAAEDERIPKKIDMVWIDGNHFYSYVLVDLNLWAPRTQKLVCGHDYNFTGVGQAVNEFYGDKVKFGPGSIWYVFVDNQAVS